jgi:hypothetical protein
MPLPGPPDPQLLLILGTQLAKVGLPLSVVLLKYSAKNCPAEQLEGVENVAVTVVTAFKLRTQFPVPLQPPPLQPANVEPDAAVAVSVTLVPAAYASEQSVEQLMPAGLLVTVPLPIRLTVNVTGVEVAVNVAVIEVLTVILRIQLPVPLHPPPLQPANVDPDAGVAVSVTMVPAAYASEQSEEQLIPAGLLVTVPFPTRVIVRVAVAAGVVAQTSLV